METERLTDEIIRGCDNSDSGSAATSDHNAVAECDEQFGWHGFSDEGR
jgi:hypothetical protein